MNIKEIKLAVKSGLPVYWQNKSYRVLIDSNDWYYIRCTVNGSCIGLHGGIGTEYENVLNGKEDDFCIGLDNDLLGVTVDSLIEAALWSSTEELYAEYNIFDVEVSSLVNIYNKVKTWLDDNKDLIEALPDSYRRDMVGHDVWLTALGHGVGFWDRGLDELGDKLTTSVEGLFTDEPFINNGKIIFE